jgi:AAA domain, putative AbiEii toxin, Type IV TA system
MLPSVITRLRLADFKAFHELNLELRPVTVLLGENSTGKSSIIAALRLLAQTESGFDSRVPLLLKGDLGDFGTYRDVVYGNHRGRPFKLELSCEDPDEPALAYQLSLEFKYRTVRRELVLRQVSVSELRPARHLITVTYSFDASRYLITRLGNRNIPAAQRARAAENLRMFHFLPMLSPTFRPTRGRQRLLEGILPERQARDIDRAIDEAVFFIRDDLGGLDYISAMRMAPERTYPQTGEVRSRIGANGENWISILARELNASARSRSRILPELRRWLRASGLASDVAVRWASDRYFELELRHPISGEWENIADVGQANSQVLPVLVGGLRLGPRATYLVEEPEIHLHPRAQAELGDFFVHLYNRGVWSIVETHSEYLLLRLQQHIADGALDPKDILFYYVSAVRRGKRVQRLTLDSNARFVDPIPGGFFPERLEEAKKLARLRGSNVLQTTAAD